MIQSLPSYMLYIFMKLCPQSFGIFSSLLRQDFSNDAVVQKNMNQHLDGYKIFKKMKKYCQNQQNQIEQLNKALEIEQKAIQQKNESQQLPKLINDHQQSGIKKPFYMFQKRDLLFEIKAEINELEQSLLIKRNHLAYVLYLLNDFKPKKNVQTLLKEYAFLNLHRFMNQQQEQSFVVYLQAMYDFQKATAFESGGKHDKKWNQSLRAKYQDSYRINLERGWNKQKIQMMFEIQCPQSFAALMNFLGEEKILYYRSRDLIKRISGNNPIPNSKMPEANLLHDSIRKKYIFQEIKNALTYVDGQSQAAQQTLAYILSLLLEFK